MLAMLVASLAVAVAVAMMEPAAAYDLVREAAGALAERAREVLVGGAVALWVEESLRWVLRQPWRWQAARFIARWLLVGAAAAVAATAFLLLVWAAVASAVVATVELVEQAWLVFEALAAEIAAPAPELARVLVLGAALRLVMKWGSKKQRPRRRRY